MMGDFDPNDETSWYFGMFTREESMLILQAERDSGVFLVRDSRSIHGDFVLCVKEDVKISNYIINKIQTNGQIAYRIGDQEFSSLSALLGFYKIHYLDTTSLIRPAKRPQYVANCDFTARYPDNLSFKQGERFTLLRKDDDEWWTVKDSKGSVGSVPGNLLDRFDESSAITNTSMSTFPASVQTSATSSLTSSTTAAASSSLLSSTPASATAPAAGSRHSSGMKLPRSLPAKARAIRTRIPNAYDTTQLKLTAGDEVLVTAIHMTGQWEGVINGQCGFFPFHHIKFEDDNEDDE